MLLSCIKNENRKLHHSVIWLACVFIPIIPAIMGTGNYWMNLEILHDGWYSLWTQFSLFYSLFFFPPMIGLYAAYLWRLEHFNHNWNTLMTMPVPEIDICLSKLFVLCKVAVITQIWMLILFFLCGKYIGLPGGIPIDMIFWSLRGTLAAFAIGSCQLFLSMVIRSFAIPIGIALGGGVIGMLLTAVNSSYGFFWPYSLMFMGMNANKSQNVLSGTMAVYLISNIFFFVLFLGIVLFILKKKDCK
ncbi:MAG: ABC transporter permease [Hespellia sp.]|nr:ABC transporter permease [Hespellia sp.]